MTDTARLATNLRGTRLNLRALLNKNDDAHDIIERLSVIQCVNCSIWVDREKSPDEELCGFCYDLDTLRF